MTDVAVRRFYYLADPNEGLLTSGSLLEFVERLAVFRDDTQMPDDQIVASPVISVPLPITLFDGDFRVRPQIHPEMLWHPLFWLPKDIGLRRVIPADPETDGEDHEETDEEWGIRVVLQCAAAGLFEPVGGTWLDVLAYAGLDIDVEDDLARISAWAEGNPDDLLDHIDLSQFFTTSGADEVADHAIAASTEFIGAQYALSAVDVYRNLDALMEEPEITGDPEAQAGAFRLWAELASLGFPGNPSSQTYEGVQTVIARMTEQLDLQLEGGSADSMELLTELRAICEDVYTTYSPFLETVANSAAIKASEEEESQHTKADEAVDASIDNRESGTVADVPASVVSAPSVKADTSFDPSSWAAPAREDPWNLGDTNPRHG